MSRKKLLKLDGISGQSTLYELRDALGMEDSEIIDTMLSVPLIKRAAKEQFAEFGGLTELVLETPEFFEWLDDILDGADIKVTIDIEHLKNY